MSDMLTNYSQINELCNYEKTFIEKPFTEFEYSLFNKHICITTKHLDALYENKDADKLMSVANYEDYLHLTDPKHHSLSLYLICTKYLIKLKDPRGYLKMGNYMLDKYEETSMTLYEHGGELGMYQCYVNLAYIHKRNNRFEEESVCIDKAIALEPMDPFLLYIKSKSIMKQTKTLKYGLEYLYKAITVGKGYKPALELMEHILSTDEDSKDSLYYMLTKVQNPNKLVTDKIRELRPKVLDEQYAKCVAIMVDDNALLDHECKLILEDPKSV